MPLKVNIASHCINFGRFVFILSSLSSIPEDKNYYTIAEEEPHNIPKKERSWREHGFRVHNYYKRTGRYTFIGRNLLRLIAVLVGFALFVWVFTTYIIDLDMMEEYIFQHLPNWLIVGTLFLSECFTGILPPDMFILWAKTFPHPYLVVFILALSSYIGGMVSWFIGTRLHHLRGVKKWVDVKFAEQFKVFRKYGGLVIFISALTPLPFSPISVVAGMVDYPFGRYLLVALSRFLRFFLYAYVFYQVL